MAQPTPSDVHIDGPLTDVALAYIQEQGNFIASTVFPWKPVQHQTDKYYKFDKNDWLRDDAFKKRAPGEWAPRSGFSLSTDSYSCDTFWGEVPLSDMVVKNADPSLPLDQAATRLVTQRGLIRLDRQMVVDSFGPNIWDTTKVGNTDFTKWNDYASDPQADIDGEQANVLEKTGREPNCLVVGYRVHKALKRHPIIKDMYKYTSSESITEDMIARALEIDKYVVAKASYATNNEGATGAYSFIAGSHALLLYTDGSPSIMEPCAGAVFAWSNLTGQNSAGVAIDQYFDNRAKEDVVRGQMAFDVKITGTDLGSFFQNAA